MAVIARRSRAVDSRGEWYLIEADDAFEQRIALRREELIALIEQADRLLTDEVHAERSKPTPELSPEESHRVRAFGLDRPFDASDVADYLELMGLPSSRKLKGSES